MFIQPTPPASPEELRQLINKYSTHDAFLNLMNVRFAADPDGLSIIRRAYCYNSKLFEGVFRQCGDSYLNGHLVPTAVLGLEYWGIKDPLLIAALLSHDSIEDFPCVTRKILSKEVHPRVAYLVCGLTKPKPNGLDPKSPEYSAAVFRKVQHYGLACMTLKFLCDRLHNMLTLWGTPEKKLAKIQETIKYVLPLMQQYNIPREELRSAILEQCITLHINDNLSSPTDC
jgi:(p)ppGpp synthase/HD superfamily hydrolase